MGANETIFEDLDGNIDFPSSNEEENSFDLESVKDDEIDVQIDSDGDDEEQPDDQEDAEEGDEDDDNVPLAASDEVDEDEDEDEKISYSKRVRKRIERERRIARKAREEAEALRLQLEAERAAKETPEGNDDDIDKLIAEKTSRLKEIRAEMDPDMVDEEVKIYDEILDLKLKKRKSESSADGDLNQQAQQSFQEEPSAPNPLAMKWYKKNQWFGKKGFEAQTVAARAIDAEVYDEGYSPDDPEYYEELNRRLKERVKLPSSRRKRKSSPVSGVSSHTPKSKGKVVLTKSDLSLMRELGLDPSNKTHLLEFANERRRTLERGG